MIEHASVLNYSQKLEIIGILVVYLSLRGFRKAPRYPFFELARRMNLMILHTPLKSFENKEKFVVILFFRYFFQNFLLIIVQDVVKTYYLILFGSQHIAACFQEASTRHQYVKGWHRVMLVPEVHLRNPFSSFYLNRCHFFKTCFLRKVSFLNAAYFIFPIEGELVSSITRNYTFAMNS